MKVTFGEAAPTYHRTGSPLPEVTTATRDDSHAEIMRRISLNRFDSKFMNDIHQRYLSRGRPLSEGQSELWEKIVHKYRKQFRKVTKVDYRDVLAQSWVNGVYSNTEILRDSFFKIEEYEGAPYMFLRFKFDKEMISEVRALVHDDAKHYLKKAVGYDDFGSPVKYPFIWNNDARHWSGPFIPQLFRQLNRFVVKHGIKQDDSVLQLIETMRERAGREDEWAIRFEESNGSYYVNNCPEALYNALVADNVDFNDMDLQQMEEVCNTYGIAPPSSLGELTKELMAHRMFDSPLEYNATTPEQQQALDQYLKATNRKAIFLMPHVSEKDIPTYEEACKPYEFATHLTSEHEWKFMTGELDTVVSTLAFTSLHSAGRSSAKVLGAMKKHIRINVTVHDHN